MESFKKIHKAIITLGICVFFLYPHYLKSQYLDEAYKIVDSISDHSLILHTDSTFELEYYDGSCWTWNTYQGNWYTKEDTLVLVDSIIFTDNSTSVYQISEKNQEKDLIIRLIDDYGNYISNYMLTYQSPITGKTDTIQTNQVGEYNLNIQHLAENGVKGWLGLEVRYDEGSFSYQSIEIKKDTDIILIEIDFQLSRLPKILKHSFLIGRDTLSVISSQECNLGNRLEENAIFIK